MTTPSSHVSIPAIDRASTDSNSSSDEPVGAGGSNSSDEPVGTGGSSSSDEPVGTGDSSSSDEVVGAGGSSSRKGKQKKDSVKKTTGKVRLTSTDPEWPKDMPDTFQTCEKDWKKEGIIFREVIHQGPYETCWAVVYTESIEAALNVKAKQERRNLHPNLSAQHLINNTRNIALDNGSMRRFKLVKKFLAEDGLVKEDVCEYTGDIHRRCTHATEEVTKIKNFQKIKKGCINEKDLVVLVAERPVMLQMEVFESFSKFKGDGIYTGPTPKEARKRDGKEQVPLHALLLIGYGTIDGIHYWIVRNSYGTDWGENGYGKVISQCSPGNHNPSLFVKVRYPEV